MNETWQVTHLYQHRHVGRVNKLHIFILLMFWLVLTYPALSTGYIPSRDVLIHLLWSSHFSDQFWLGDLYPRWLSGMNNGYGSPVFFFYGPLPYYVSALLRPLLHSDPEGWHQLGVAASLSVLLSTATMYAWLKSFSNEAGALIGTLLYMSAPYHLGWDLYQRFDYAELWAFVWMPLVLLMVQRTVEGDRRYTVGLALSYGALTLTHLPTTMIFSWIPLLYAVVAGERGQWRIRLGFTLLGMMLGMGLAAIYVIPAMLTQHNVSFADMQIGHFYYGYHFLFGGPRYNQEFSELVKNQEHYAVMMLLVAVLATLLGYFKQQEPEEKRLRLLWIVSSLLIMAMMLPIARPLWGVLPPLQAIQFPWRFNLLLTLSEAVAVALGVQAASDHNQSWKSLIILVVCIYSTLPTWRTNLEYQVVASSPGLPSIHKIEQQIGALNPEVMKKTLAAKLHIDTPEYRPKWVPPEWLSSENLKKQAAFLYKLPGSVRAWMTRQAKRQGRIELDTNAKATSWVAVHQFYYPNWVARLDKQTSYLPTRPAAVDGVLEVQVPPGKQHLILTFELGREERLGQIISMASLMLLLMLAWLFKKR